MDQLEYFSKVMDMTHKAMTKPHTAVITDGDYSVYIRNGHFELQRGEVVIARTFEEWAIRDYLSACILQDKGEEIES